MVEKVINDIHKLISKYANDSGNKILCISIKDISNHHGDNPIPKLTYEPT